MRKVHFSAFVAGCCLLFWSLIWVQDVIAERVCSHDTKPLTMKDILNPAWDEIEVGDVWDSRCAGENGVYVVRYGSASNLLEAFMPNKIGCIILRALEDSIIEGEKFEGKLLPSWNKKGEIALKSGAIIKVSFKGEKVILSVNKGKVQVLEYNKAKSVGCQDILDLVR